MINLVFLGAPGVGKGTMSDLFCRDRKLNHISTGDLLRAELAAGSDLGKTAKGYMEAGTLVPDELVAQLLGKALKARLAEANGFVFDGYPRTINQANLLDQTLAQLDLELDGVVLLDAAEEIILMRLTGRRLCKKCGKIYHTQFNPPPNGRCEVCDDGGEIYQRPDDNEESVRQRLITYAEQTKPLIDFYDERDMLIPVDASGAKDDNYAKLTAAVDSYLSE